MCVQGLVLAVSVVTVEFHAGLEKTQPTRFFFWKNREFFKKARGFFKKARGFFKKARGFLKKARFNGVFKIFVGI